MAGCLPLTLLASIPMMLQADVSDPAFMKLAEDQRPASSLSIHSSLVDTQPSNNGIAAPVYRRFTTYERKVPPVTDSFAMISNTNRETQLSNRKRRARSVPVDLRSTPEHDCWIGDKKNGKSKTRRKQRASSLGVVIPGPSFDVEGSVAGPPYFSRPWKLESPSIVLPSPQLQTLDENLELDMPVRAVETCVLPTRTTAAYQEDSPRSPDFDTPASSSRSLKRVSFSSGANEVIPDSEVLIKDSPQTQQQSTWASILLMNAGSSSRPPLARQASLPTVRGQAAGRSILKRTSSFSACGPQNNVQKIWTDVKLESSPTSENILVTPMRLSHDPTAPEFSTEFLYDNKSETGLLYDAVEATLHKAETMVVLPVRPHQTKTVLTREQRTVRHWSMEGSQWTRRSGIYASPRLPRNRTSQGPSTLRMVYMKEDKNG